MRRLTESETQEIIALSLFRYSFKDTLNGTEKAALQDRCKELMGLPLGENATYTMLFERKPS